MTGVPFLSAFTWAILLPAARALSPPSTATNSKIASMQPMIYKDVRGDLAELDSKEMIGLHRHPLPPEELIDIAKRFVEKKLGAGDESMLSDDYVFVGPTLGPFDKETYVHDMKAQAGVAPSIGFPDMKGNHFSFTVDPVEEGRVWWLTRPVGTFTREYMGAKATGEVCVAPPQTMGVLIDHDGRVSHCALGGPMDRSAGNTGGLGGVFAFWYFVGKPLPMPECYPYQKSIQFRFLSWLGSLVGNPAVSKTTEE